MLGPKREQFLFEIQIERYGTSQIERDGGRICCRQILPGASDRQQLGMQLNGPRSIDVYKRQINAACSPLMAATNFLK